MPPPNHDTDFPMDLLCHPDDIVLSVPFTTNGSLVPQAAMYLNELNLSKDHGEVVPEEVLMQQLGLYFTNLTNRNVYSLHPNNNITYNIIDLWTLW